MVLNVFKKPTRGHSPACFTCLLTSMQIRTATETRIEFPCSTIELKNIFEFLITYCQRCTRTYAKEMFYLRRYDERSKSYQNCSFTWFQMHWGQMFLCFLPFPSIFFSTLQSHCSRLSVGLLSYVSRSTLYGPGVSLLL